MDRRLEDVLSVSPDELGWIVCPRCNFRFSARDGNAWSGRRHLRCGQRLALEGWFETVAIEAPQPGWVRGLYEALQKYDGLDAYRKLLSPWASASHDELRERLAVAFEPYARQPREPWDSRDALREASWELYALSRVADLLLLAHQPEAPAQVLRIPGENMGPAPAPLFAVSLDDIVAFFGALGLREHTVGSHFDPSARRGHPLALSDDGRDAVRPGRRHDSLPQHLRGARMGRVVAAVLVLFAP